MLQKEQKSVNDRLRRNIWRSLLILKSASVADLIGVVRGLNVRKARAILRELETHGYVAKVFKRGRPEYFHAVDSPSLPAVCGRCGRGFDCKACTPKEAKKERETERQAARERKKKRAAEREALAEVISRGIRDLSDEVHDDAA